MKVGITIAIAIRMVRNFQFLIILSIAFEFAAFRESLSPLETPVPFTNDLPSGERFPLTKLRPLVSPTPFDKPRLLIWDLVGAGVAICVFLSTDLSFLVFSLNPTRSSIEGIGDAFGGVGLGAPCSTPSNCTPQNGHAVSFNPTRLPQDEHWA